ncbi:histidinol-phosphate transaminase [Acuticoccus sediminis]|uniref:Histidinol-phosphate aminotransferase n=1 Tax=Acuticoccus sediminis TaxID=2184697 RepID=A0A8B2NS37_9HYPH|nr:histidinol-phosphate transaminase [Acuticoccus sediminis]RAH98192.1 histidinol-phosphate transaminase [Acuticoccus sediminis]
MSAPLTMRPVARESIMRIAPYVPGRSTAGANRKEYKLSSNENPLGPSPAARQAFIDAASSLEKYPDGGATALRDAVASTYGLKPDRIICGNGSDEILSMIAHAYLEEGDEAIFTEHAFLMYRIVTLAAGGTPVVVDEPDMQVDVDRILEAVTERTKVVFLANPNNPTGSYTPASEVKRLREGLPGNVLLVIDAAYAEYVRKNDYESGIELVATREDTIMTRTFSKIHALAGLRLGWAYAPANVIDALHRVRGPFNVNAPAIAAGVAALADRAHMERAVEHNNYWLPEVTRRVRELGFGVPDSVGNFVLIDFSTVPGGDAGEADDFLGARGCVLRRVAGYGLPQMLRMTIGDEEANEAVIAALAEYREGLAGA